MITYKILFMRFFTRYVSYNLLLVTMLMLSTGQVVFGMNLQLPQVQLSQTQYDNLARLAINNALAGERYMLPITKLYLKPIDKAIPLVSNDFGRFILFEKVLSTAHTHLFHL